MTDPQLTVPPPSFDHTTAERRELVVSSRAYEALRRESLRTGKSMERLILEMVK